MNTVEKRECETSKCNNPVHTRGYCGKCYMRKRRDGSLKRKPKRKCLHPGCDDLSRARRYCAKHYVMMRKAGLFGEIMNEPQTKQIPLDLDVQSDN